jgi:hypothetical protein
MPLIVFLTSAVPANHPPIMAVAFCQKALDLPDLCVNWRLYKRPTYLELSVGLLRLLRI